jgi:transposase
MDDSSILLKEYELVRLNVVQQMFSKVSASSAARMLEISVRQAFRLKARVRRQGAKGIIHGNRGRRPANAKPASLRQQVLELHRTRFSKYNDYHFAEALEEEYELVVNRETLRRWLRAEGIPSKRRHHSRSNHRRRRERRARFGELLFIDGSPHPWFGLARPASTLILATDDATGRPLYGLFAPQETLAACFEVFYYVCRLYGLPAALYLDRASQFTTTRHGGTHRFQRDDNPTSFETAMQTLAVQLIFANSPQARGRGERINESFQDRLVAELDHHGITDPVAATDYLNRVFIPKYAKRFGVKPRDARPAFRPIPRGLDLHTVLCVKDTREVTNDNTINYQGQIYQLKPNCRSVCIAGTKIMVQEWFDGSVHVRHDRAGTIPAVRLPDRPRTRQPSAPSPYDTLAVAQV